MKKIIVFGATGGTGKVTVTEALQNGWGVTVIIRNPSAFEIKHSNLKIVKGDVMQSSTFAKEIIGNDAVISCLGVGTSLKPTTVYSAGTKNILEAMKNANVQRLICISAGGVETTKQMGFFIRTLTKVLLQRILKNLYADMRLMEDIVSGTNINYTIMRPARLTTGKQKRKYRIAINSHIKMPWSISKTDLAHAMLSLIDNPITFKSIIEIAY